MADIKYYDVIKKPVITEKSMNAMAEKKYTFLVHPEANRQQRYRNLRRTLIDSPCGMSATSEALLLMNPRHSDYREYTHSKA